MSTVQWDVLMYTDQSLVSKHVAFKWLTEKCDKKD